LGRQGFTHLHKNPQIWSKQCCLTNSFLHYEFQLSTSYFEQFKVPLDYWHVPLNHWHVLQNHWYMPQNHWHMPCSDLWYVAFCHCISGMCHKITGMCLKIIGTCHKITGTCGMWHFVTKSLACVIKSLVSGTCH